MVADLNQFMHLYIHLGLLDSNHAATECWIAGTGWPQLQAPLAKYVMYHDIYHVIMLARAYKNVGHCIKIIENLWNSVFLFLKCILYLMEPHYRND